MFIRELFLSLVAYPELRFWVQLPARVDSLHLYRQALSAGIAITPGYLFSPTNQYRNFVRLNAANWSDEAEQAIQRLGEMIAALS